MNSVQNNAHILGQSDITRNVTLVYSTPNIIRMI